MKHRIAVINQKGGVGKTTSTINLAAYLAKQGASVLIVDADPQGNATSGFGIDKHAIEASLYDVLFSKTTLQKATIDTNTKGVSIVPSNSSLASAEVDMVSIDDREHLLKNAIKNDEHDFILIDCPPSLGLLTVNALTAANSILMPVQAEYYALEGLSQLLEVVQDVRGGLGVLLTMYDTRTSLSGQVRDEVKKHFGDSLFETVIPRNIRLAEAPSHGKTIIDHDKWSKGARAYKALAKEVLSRVK
jgi:chromosome partitioning protein